MVFLLALFFVLRGRIKIEHGKAGYTVSRFTGLERFAHWLMAGSFVVLAISGLNMLFGRYVLMPVIGKEAFAFVTLVGQVPAQLSVVRLHGRRGAGLRAVGGPQLSQPP